MAVDQGGESGQPFEYEKKQFSSDSRFGFELNGLLDEEA
jgi:hypothetical protein